MNTEFNKIIRAFKKTGLPFAVTGSWAIKIHAEKAGLQPHREPHDFDFIVSDTNYPDFISVLSGFGYNFDGDMPLLGGRKKINRVAMKKGSYEIDLLRAGSSLAPSLNAVIKYNNTPVASINSLISQKKEILNNLENKKARINYNFLIAMKKSPPPSPKSFGLVTIIKSSPSSSPRPFRIRGKRSPSSSPVKRRNLFKTPSPVKGRNLFKTPSPVKGRNLFKTPNSSPVKGRRLI